MKTFVPTFLSEPFPNGYDPLVFDKVHFADGQYRVMFMVAGSHKELHKTADFVTFTQIDADWLATAVPGNAGVNTFQDHVVLPDGTFVLYQNDNTEGATAVWTGTATDVDAGTITRLGQVLSTEGDGGVFYEAATNTVHIFTEDADSPFGNVSSSKLSHWTTPANDLLNATQHADATDTGGTWGTGDPDIIEVDGVYWMFCDYTTSHPTYWIALYRSDDLYTWELVDETLTAPTGKRAGDFDVVAVDDHWIALSEYTGGDAGIGVWRLDLVEIGTLATASITSARTIIGGAPADIMVAT